MRAIPRLSALLLCGCVSALVLAANDPMLGKWHLSDASKAAHPQDLTEMYIEAAAGGYVVHMGMPNLPAAVSLHIILDGKPHPYLTMGEGADAPPGPPPHATCHRAQARQIQCTVSADGQPPGPVSVTLSADGKSIRLADPEPAVYERR